MRIVVCIKQIIDPEIPPDLFRLDPDSRRQIRGGLSLVISAYDQNALEVALQLREKAGGSITALTVGAAEAQGAVKSAMGMGVDAGVLVADPAAAAADSFGIAAILAGAVRKLGAIDLVLTGCVSGDTGSMVMAPLLAEELGWPCLSFASRIAPHGGAAVRARRLLEDAYETVEAPLPLVAGVISDDSNVPRYSKLKDIMAAARRPVAAWTLTDLGIAPALVAPASHQPILHDVVIPVREARCELIAGESAEEQARRLAHRLRELKVL
jgi:electron transfer flavoprotein beta subunit